MKVLNLYAGLGGNRKNWTDCEVTAVETNCQIAALYKRFYPEDHLVLGDAHEYLRLHYSNFDFIWSSPPCQTHSKMVKATRHKSRRYPDMKLYEEIIFLQHFFKGLWVVENVVPFYTPLIKGKKNGRHMFWSNFEFVEYDVPSPPGFFTRANLAGKRALMDWLGIHYNENIYYDGNHCPAQILRNCVHPKIGEHIFQTAKSISR